MASTIKVDNVQNTPGTNIINKCSTTITIGASSDTIALACGASQTGFGRTGTVDWETSIQTGTVTAATGKGYFVNTTSGGITVNLPAAAVGSIVAISDYASTAASNNITVTPNGSDKINGVNDSFKISTAGLAVTLVYADATRGWKSVTGSDEDATGVTPAFVTATGGNTTITSGDYKTHIFTGPGTLCVSCAGNADGSNTVEHLIVAGGGGGARGSGAGAGGAGGYRTSYPSPVSGGTSISASPYPIAVGGGGAGSTTYPAKGVSGSVSSGLCLSSAGGGGAGSGTEASKSGADGGSGGGGAHISGNSGGTGNEPPVSPPQGNPGGAGGGCYAGGGGGGATVAGTAAPGPAPGGTGGPIADAYFGPTAPSYGTPGPVGSTRYFAGGGGGGGQPPSPPPGGTGGAGGGGDGNFGPPDSPGDDGTVNTGGGGGGAGGPSGNGGAGAPGFVAIRYKYQ